MRLLKNDLNLEMTKGDTLSFGVKIYELGQPLEVADFTCKTNFFDSSPIFQKSLGNGVTLADTDAQGNYTYRVRIAPGDTGDLAIGKYYYDFQIKLNSDVFTILKGVLTLDYDVTQGG